MSDTLRVLAQRTDVNHEELRAALGGAWRELVAVDVPSDAISILMAQSALETGRWRGCICWNLGGIKASAKVLHSYYPTVEYWPRERAERDVNASTSLAPCKFAKPDDGGAYREVLYSPSHPMCRFAAYVDLASGARAYLRLLSRRYAAALDAAMGGDPIAFVAALTRCGYFTAASAKYEAAVAGLFDEFREPCLSTSAEIRAVLALVGFADVKGFQQGAHLMVDGIVGSRTRAAIRARL